MKINTESIVNFAINGVEKFLQENPTLTFYALAFDCNAEYAEINLCLNTEEAFSERLAACQSGRFAEQYQTAERIYDLKYNTGDWEYQSFDTFYVFTDEELTMVFNDLYPNGVEDDYQAWIKFTKELLGEFTKSLLTFSKTETFKKIPKTTDFEFFCIDHDEELETAKSRMAQCSK
ncbi:hypothetical protein C1903_03880 [Listeria ivanovii]|uniref:DUF4303 domain-containing protein n=1 Tax=Listeria ivanovii TaxID=1638 RepID=UPI000DAA0089|nr:DUF4303 domain-containing protein [Listeria ivanovii]PZF90325.1 hypothetical protein C1905_03495 [Listeria ivanovii]PZF95780.1 hypothetical protein C1903_03880 [Listeria ivanovii]PZG06056.1 hypothetical protein C2L88_03875 [Listeria ivanovii]PZG10894.1 hypothetical protein C1901_03875 [Listeria ivanovii]PZG27841.1 hypothetical protein C1900_03500 [Listeria ivanovii]